jgi:hypothetical protein
LTDATADWQIIHDPGDPIHVTISNPSGVSGSVPLLSVQFALPALALPGEALIFGATDASVSDESGTARSLQGFVQEGRVTVGNVAPVADDVTISGFEDHPVVVNLQATSGDGGLLTYQVVPPQNDPDAPP